MAHQNLSLSRSNSILGGGNNEQEMHPNRIIWRNHSRRNPFRPKRQNRMYDKYRKERL